MGVQNFWQLIESTGRPVNMNKGLEGKVLAIDVSIWLHQAAKGMRDRQNAHILLLLNRICKLLHFKIKPIFVFDGGVPELKRRTLAERRQRRDIATAKAKEAKNKIRTNYLKTIAIQQLRGEIVEPVMSLADEDREKDLFELPDTHLRAQLPIDDDEVLESDDSELLVTTRSKRRVVDDINYHYVLPNVNEIDDEALKDLPIEMQHEILTDMKESLKRTQQRLEDLPQKSDDFSSYQLQKLLKQNTVAQKILELNQTIKRQKFDISLESNATIFAGKLASDANTQFILVKPDKTQKSTPDNQPSISTTSSLSRQPTSDFCANNLMERDPVIGLIQQRDTTTETDSVVKDDDLSWTEEKSQSATKDIVIVEENPTQESDEECVELELALKRSLEDQQTSVVSDKQDTSSSDTDDNDFIDVPILPITSEPAILLSLMKNEDRETTESKLVESDEDESNDSITAIEDVKEALDEIQEELTDDTAVQLNTARTHERSAMTLTDTMHEDTRYLLRLFGIPYLISPTEAEAQCAHLDLTKQCDGVITDDSDVWLFGASHVYRHFFRQDQLVEYYDSTIIHNQLGLDRESMIAVAMIVGSDYTKGIPNAGIMTAIEILQEFHGTCMERLEKFRRWWRKAQHPEYKIQSKVLKRLRNLELFEGFPNKDIYDAYNSPKVDCDQSKFTWAMPQLELIREFIGSKLKWDRQKIDDMILPVIKRMNSKEIQSRIDSFFAPYPSGGTSNQIGRNLRLKSALDLLKQKTQESKDKNNELSLSDDDDDTTLIPQRNPTARRKRTKKTKLMNDVLECAEKTTRRSKKKQSPIGPVLSEDDTY